MHWFRLLLPLALFTASAVIFFWYPYSDHYHESSPYTVDIVKYTLAVFLIATAVLLVHRIIKRNATACIVTPDAVILQNCEIAKKKVVVPIAKASVNFDHDALEYLMGCGSIEIVTTDGCQHRMTMMCSPRDVENAVEMSKQKAYDKKVSDDFCAAIDNYVSKERARVAD